MNIIKQELKQNYPSTLIWIASMVAIACLYIWIYPTLVDGADFSEIISNFPEVFKKSFGISDDSFSAFPGLYSTILTFVILAGSVQAMSLGTRINSKEISRSTAEFLLTKPTSRANILNQKIISGLILLVITNLAYLLLIWAMIQLVISDSFTFSAFLTSSLSLLIVQLFFFGIGFLSGALLPRIKSVIGITLPTVFGLYIFGLLDTIIGEDKIQYLTPFKFFDISNLASGGSYSISMLIYIFVLISAILAATYYYFRKRDIYTL